MEEDEQVSDEQRQVSRITVEREREGKKMLAASSGRRKRILHYNQPSAQYYWQFCNMLKKEKMVESHRVINGDINEDY